MLLFLLSILSWLVFTIVGVIYLDVLKIVYVEEKEQGKSETCSNSSRYKIRMNPQYYNLRTDVDTKKTAVVGLLAIYNTSVVEPFFYSLRKTGYKDEIICFTLDKNIMTYYRLFQKYDVTYVLFKNKYPYYISNNKNYPISSQLSRNISKIPFDKYYYANLRFFMIYNWLLVYHSIFSYILTSDIRDTLFQRNPFEWNYNRGIYLSHETQHCRYSESKECCRCNYDWLYNLNPPEYILNNTFINAGQIFGSSIEIRDFLKGFTEIMYEIHLKNKIRNDTCDQGILNYYVYNTSEFDYPVYLFEAEHGFARSIGLDLISNKYGFELNDNLTIVNEDGTVPVMVHQYDIGLKYGSVVRRIKFRHYYEYYVDI